MLKPAGKLRQVRSWPFPWIESRSSSPAPHLLTLSGTALSNFSADQQRLECEQIRANLKFLMQLANHYQNFLSSVEPPNSYRNSYRSCAAVYF